MTNNHLPDLQNPDEVRKAILGYFDSCAENGTMPGNEGLYAALGINRTDWFCMRNGRTKRAAPECVRLIAQAVQFLGAYREQLLYLPDDQLPVHPGRLRTWIKLYDLRGCQPKHHKPHPKRKKVNDDG